MIVAHVRRRRQRHHSGFSLIELAVALAVIAVLLGAVLVPLTTQISQRNETATQKMLEQINEALLGYAAAAGRLPCPATENSNGAEDFAAGGDATNGNCESFWGFVPAVTLGLSAVDGRGFAIDAWGTRQNRIRYAVSSETLNGVQNPFTRAGGMRSATMAWVVSSELLHVCASSAGVLAGTHCTTAVPYDSTNTLTNTAPAVIWSVGSNAATTGGISNDEMQNPNPNTVNAGSADRIFVSHGRTAVPEFDDIVTWMSAARLVNRMIVAGQLP
jgi:prepilin-type N-terminal cleavage/methylation domain-containing protein